MFPLSSTLLSVPQCYSMHLPPSWINRSVDEVDTEEMQQQAPKHKIRKCPLLRNTLKLLHVLRVRLHPQTRREYELSDSGAEA